MPHALLLSPDDQAVNAITGVLEDMSVTCERPLDGVSAAQKLNSQSFDLVLVDCENLPAAKLIFDVCRRGKTGTNPIPIAIVDGRAGLPTAFRLGAELILTKPVAKDQARSTIRTAISRVKKEVAANEAVAPTTATGNAATGTEARAMAAAAGVSSQTTTCVEPASSIVSAAASSTSTTASDAMLTAPAVATEMHSTVKEIDTAATPKLNPQSETCSTSAWQELSSSSEVSARTDSTKAKFARPLEPSDDPVLAELERTELEAELNKLHSETSTQIKTTSTQPAAKSNEPFPPLFQNERRAGRGPLVALLMLLIAVGGFYGVWMYQPGFREVAQPQIDRLLNLVGMGPAPGSKPSAQVATIKTVEPAAQSSSNPEPVQSTAPNPAATAVSGATTTSAPPAAPLQPATTAPGASKPEAGKPSETSKDITSTSSPDGALPGEKSAIVLSSKEAEQHLAHSVPAKFPADSHAGEAEAIVVLKTVVNANGEVEGLRLVDGNAALAPAAMQAVKQWRYRPYIRDGKAQAFQTVVVVDFQRP
jgi:periplasmic protein TonB